MSEFINVIVNGEPRPARIGSPLSEIIAGEKPCGGHGKCGKCKVYASGKLSPPSDAELKLLSKQEIARGIRLSCCTVAEGDCEVKSLESAAQAQIVTGGKQVGYSLNPTFEKYGAAVDIGTTTLAARLYDKNGVVLAETSRLNPQSQFGADVISRIEAALGGNAQALADTIRGAISDIIVQLAFSAKIDTHQIDSVAITGNTVMLSLLTLEDTEPFSHAPFEAKHLFGEVMKAGELDFPVLCPDAQIYLPPCISAFVGADTVCALLATGLCERDSAMLVDIGTNGEMAVWHKNSLTVCSTAAGPAFEGVGISMGMRGAAGAIDKVRVDNEEIKFHVIGGGEAVGICGSGLVDAAACMLDCDILDETGALDDDPFMLQNSVSITGRDIRMLQLAKSAICAGLLTLLESAELEPKDVPILYIAGGFGNYLNKESAAKIGLLPCSLAENSETVGNAALSGASMLLLDSDLMERAKGMAESARVIDLSTNKGFSERYMLGMIFEEV